MNFESLREDYPDNLETYIAVQEPPNFLYFPRGDNLALWLRILGYKERILMTTRGIPDPSDIREKVEKLNFHLAKFEGAQVLPTNITDIINGVASKDPRSPLQCWASSIRYGGWDKKVLRNTSYPVALYQLVRSLYTADSAPASAA